MGLDLSYGGRPVCGFEREGQGPAPQDGGQRALVPVMLTVAVA